MIELTNINKAFKVFKRKTGTVAALTSLFHREYTMVHALKDISFSISPGEIVGYIGPNGAGKSTTIKIMSGILRPDGGTCVINGRIPWKQRKEHVAHIGVVFGQRTQLWWDVPVADSYEMLRDIYAVKPDQYRKTLDELTEALDIGNILHTPLRQLSLGQRMRCEIAGSLLHSPSLLFLDEPTIGLDAVSKLAVRAFLQKLNKEQGTTILLTTHDMYDIEALTDRIILIGKGQLLYNDSFNTIKTNYDKIRTLTVTFSRYSGEPLTLPETEMLEWSDTRAVYRFPSELTPTVIAQLSNVLHLTDITAQGTSVEDVIAHLYEDFQL